MKKAPMAVPAGIFLLTLAVPLTGQIPDEMYKGSSARFGAQVESQGLTPVAVPARQLSPEEKGDLFMARKQYREAAVTYKDLADQSPQNAVYLNKLGIAMHQQADLAQALKYYQRALKADPRYADAQNNIGTVWYQRKKFGKAIRAYRKAIKTRDDMPVLYSNLGYAYFGDKKYEEAIAAFRVALSKDPEFFEHNTSRTGSLLQDRSVSDRGRFYFMLAKSFAEAGNLERCILYLRKAKDEGYKALADVKKDPAFSTVLKDPAVQLLLAPNPNPTEAEQP
jgi:tetratricopeptide (TPR) repeat protein